jgi:predicted small lipoprotein YifL
VVAGRKRCLIGIAVIGALAAALTLAGCGRKSGLDRPPETSFGDPVSAVLQKDPGPGHDADGKPVAPPGPKKSTFLDWLID